MPSEGGETKGPQRSLNQRDQSSHQEPGTLGMVSSQVSGSNDTALQGLGVAPEVVGGCNGIQPLPGPEGRAPPPSGFDVPSGVDGVFQPTAIKQIYFLEIGESGLVDSDRVLKAFVVRNGRHGRFAGASKAGANETFVNATDVEHQALDDGGHSFRL